MDDDLSYVATPSKEYQSRELDAFNEAIHGDEPRFTHFEGKMFSEDWANNELIPFLRVAYRAKPGITLTHNWWEELRKAEFIEPANMPNYSVDDPIFIERLRLVLAAPGTLSRRTLVANVARDMPLTIRLLIRHCVLHGGPYKLGSLPATIRPELADEVALAEMTDECVTGLFKKEWKK